MSDTAVDLLRAVEAKARELGFDRVGVAPAVPGPRAEFLADWLGRGYAGEMAYMVREPERRADPRRLLPDARSVLVLAARYAHKSGEPAPGAKIARYARSRDYHDVLGGRLRALAAFVESAAPGARARPCVDTSAVLEKPLAAAAGIGWQGKHTNVIAQELGSYFFLGEVLTTLDLPPSAPVRDRCGTCARCIDACPTRAIVAPYVLDATRCISYLTIEHRGWIDLELRPLMGDWIFGCDICQEVCPWVESFTEPTADPDFRPLAATAVGDPRELLSLDEAAFRARFRGTPIVRAKRGPFLRNVCIALGNTGGPAAVPALTAALNDSDPLVRGHAAWALRRIGGDAALAALDARRAVEPDPRVLEEVESR